VFGWAVVALFGETSGPKKVWLSALVAAAAAWPLLVIGIAAPRVAALVLTFVPLPAWIPDGSVRLGWILLALAVPLAVGLAMAMQRPVRTAAPATQPPNAQAATAPTEVPAARESSLVRTARGFPITLGVAAAFLIVFVTVPVLRVVSFIRRRIDLHVPLITDADSYDPVASEIARTLTAHGFQMSRADPPWWMTAPSRILLWVDSTSFGAYVPKGFAYYRGARLEAALYPNGLLLRGREQDTAWAHGMLVEALTATPGLQTFDPGAQEIEKQIRRVWQVYRENPEAHRQSSALSGRLTEISQEIRQLPVAYDEWQIVYRQALQLGRALAGEHQLLERTSRPAEADTMDETLPEEAVMTTPISRAGMARAENLSTRELVAEIMGKASLLVKKEVELAKNEVQADLRSELAMAKAIAAGVVAGLLGVNTLLVAVVLGLATRMPGWLAALVVGGVILIIAAVVAWVGWSWRVRTPLAVTRKTLKEDVQWAKERVA
jgi:hypothetical protein